MSTPLQTYLNHASVPREKLSRSGIEEARLEALMSGADPTIDEIRAIAKSLNVKTRQLISGRAIEAPLGLKLRQNFAVADFINTAETIDITDRAYSFSHLLPDRTALRAGSRIEDRDFKAAEWLAQVCRQEILRVDDKSPILNLDQRIISRTSIYLVISQFRSIEGSTLSLNGRQFVFLAQRHDARMRFTLAHELAHYLVDLLDEDGGWFDKDVLQSGGDNRTTEWFANTFAAALLLPYSGIADALTVFRRRHKIASDGLSDIEILFLARLFGVNFQVAARRCEDLQLLPRGGGQSLYSKIIETHKSPEERADGLGLPKRQTYDWGAWSKFFLSRIQPAINSSEVSVGRLAELMGLPVSQLSQELNFDADLY